jgi:ferredoxin-NADP reductase
MTDSGVRWRRLRVTRRTRESSVITSLHLVADDGSALPPFEPGQFLTFKVPDGAGGETTRSYSLSSDPIGASA